MKNDRFVCISSFEGASMMAFKNIGSALADQIVTLHKNEALPTPFCVKDIRVHFQNQFRENHIRTVLANYCEGTGYEVLQGRKARFKRISKGMYISI
jgi:hypothetical protein